MQGHHQRIQHPSAKGRLEGPIHGQQEGIALMDSQYLGGPEVPESPSRRRRFHGECSSRFKRQP